MHRALALLAAAGWTPEQAERGLLIVASTGLSLDSLLAGTRMADDVDQLLRALEGPA